MDDHIRDSLRLFDGDVAASAAYVYIRASAPQYKPKRPVPALRELQQLTANTIVSRVGKQLAKKIRPKQRRIFPVAAEEAEFMITRRKLYSLSPDKFFDFYMDIAENLSREQRHKFVLRHATKIADQYNFMWHWIKLKWQDSQKFQRKPVLFATFLENVKEEDILHANPKELSKYYFDGFYSQLSGVGFIYPDFTRDVFYYGYDSMDLGFWDFVGTDVDITKAQGYEQVHHNLTLMFDALFSNRTLMRAAVGLKIHWNTQSWYAPFNHDENSKYRFIAKRIAPLLWDSAPLARLLVTALLATQTPEYNRNANPRTKENLVAAQPGDYFWRPTNWASITTDPVLHALPTESVIFSIDFYRLYPGETRPFSVYRYFFRPDATMKEILPELLMAMDWIQENLSVIDVRYFFEFNIDSAPNLPDRSGATNMEDQLRSSMFLQWQTMLAGNYTPEEAWAFIEAQNWGINMQGRLREWFMMLTEEDEAEFVQKARLYIRDEGLGEIDMFKRIIDLDTRRQTILNTRHKLRTDQNLSPVIYINEPIMMSHEVIVPTHKIAFKS